MKLQARDIMGGLTNKNHILHEISPKESELLKKTLLEMMEDIHLVCIDNNIGYSLHGGTILGAIRHQGFIPWDDDLDIAMLRRDWEKFKSIFEEKLGEKYVLEAPNYGNKDTKTYFGKIYKKGTTLIELQDINAPFNKGIYIDIFIVENVSDNKIIKHFDAIISDCWKAITTCQIYYRYPNDLFSEYMHTTISSNIYFKIRKFIGFCFSFISHKKLVSLYDHFISRHPDTTKYITVPTGRAFYTGEILPRETWNPLKLMKFEDYNFYGQADPKAYCLKHYGPTYMELPPIDKRERHFCVKLDFNMEMR
ncbi:MAG: LicD family protein [Clostridia bacterium]|nr:LicD family protein [Clostridia bacterium]